MQTHVQAAKERVRADMQSELNRLQLRLNSIEASFANSISEAVRNEVNVVKEPLTSQAIVISSAPPPLSVEALSELFSQPLVVTNIEQIWGEALMPKPADENRGKRPREHEEPRVESKEEERKCLQSTQRESRWKQHKRKELD